MRTSKNITRIYELEEGETDPVMGVDPDTGEAVIEEPGVPLIYKNLSGY